jgi:hypothetical protein
MEESRLSGSVAYEQLAINVQKGSGTIWTFDDELARRTNVQIVPDPFWTLAARLAATRDAHRLRAGGDQTIRRRERRMKRVGHGTFLGKEAS